MGATNRTEARRRALRAAQLVTLSLSLAGCGAVTPLPIGDGSVTDFGLADGGHDAGRDAGDAGPMCDSPGAPCGTTDGLCNHACGFTYDSDCCACGFTMGCAAVGPFVPPSMA
jgi:predicted small lipoprotein YifL